MSDTVTKNDLKVADPSTQKQTKLPNTAQLQTAAEMEHEIKRLELESKQLEVEERKANLIDIKEKLGERELRREQVRQRSKINGETLKQINDNERAVQERCNHRKGGNGLSGYISGQGDDDQYAVWKHQFANGDTWVGCLRCKKKWKPPAKSDHTKEDVFNQASYDDAVREYQRALNFPTKNVPSGSTVFKYSEGGVEFYRENTKNS